MVVPVSVPVPVPVSVEAARMGLVVGQRRYITPGIVPSPMAQTLPNISQTHPNAPKRSQTLPNSPKLSQTLPNAPKRSPTLPNAPKLSHLLAAEKLVEQETIDYNEMQVMVGKYRPELVSSIN